MADHDWEQLLRFVNSVLNTPGDSADIDADDARTAAKALLAVARGQDIRDPTQTLSVRFGPLPPDTPRYALVSTVPKEKRKPGERGKEFNAERLYHTDSHIRRAARCYYVGFIKCGRAVVDIQDRLGADDVKTAKRVLRDLKAIVEGELYWFMLAPPDSFRDPTLQLFAEAVQSGSTRSEQINELVRKADQSFAN